ncbi:Spy/CpxP family protein refolding chaperone [Alteromonas sp. S015]|uniref:Spy/CpxP family protein refolding chaperone n=1 Tax=Alteromonas sp. S015 TaxID=3117401 RepID=UPI002FDFB097
MKKLLIASATVAAISLGGLALAQPAGPGMRHHEPVKEIVKHLRGLSLSDTQREEIKTLVSAFKDANPRPEYQDSEKPDFDFETASEAQVSAFIETQFEERESKQFALAQLRHNIFNVLSEEQQSKVLAREESRKEKREAQGDKRRNAPNEQKSQFAKRMDAEGKGKKFRGHSKGERGGRGHQHNGMPFKGIDLTDDQLANLAKLRKSFKDTSKANSEILQSFKDAQRTLIRSSSFSQDTWNALVAEYKDDLVSAGVEKAKQRQAMLAVLTPAQQAELKAQREDGRKLRELLRS